MEKIIGYVSFREDRTHPECNVTFKRYDDQKDTVRNISVSDSAHGMMEDFTVRGVFGEYAYAECYYHGPYAISLNRAQSMVKFLKPFHAKLDKLAEQFGNTDDYCETLARACSVLKVDRLVFGDDLHCSMYTEIDGNVSGKLHHIGGARSRIAKWIGEHRVVKQAA